MKTTAALQKTTRTVGKMFFALAFLLLAVVVGFGGTALFVYHQFGDIRRPAAPAHGTTADRRPAAQPAVSAAGQDAALRRVANGPSDQSAYTYADNKGGQPTAPAGRTRLADATPAPLDPSSQAGGSPNSLSDPESHYIVDARTGRVVGIDGSAGARREAQQESSQPPLAVAVQTPPPEVRVASPVLADGMPIYHGPTVAPANPTGAQYVPIRKALPVTSSEADQNVRSFNVGEYMVNDQERPVLRAQAVVPASARVVKATRVYRLSDGSQTAAAE